MIDERDHLGLMYDLAGRWAAALGCDRAELLGEAFLALRRSCERFDPLLGFWFSTFAHRCITNRLIRHRDHFLRERMKTRLKNRVRQPYRLGEADLPVMDRREPFEDRRRAARESLQRLIDGCESLTDQQRHVLHCRAVGMTHEQVGATVGVSRARAHQIVKEAIEIIQEEAEVHAEAQRPQGKERCRPP